MTLAKGCHLVGSVPFRDPETVFRECSARLSKRLKRLPDGEPGKRNYFILFQREIFPPSFLCDFKDNAIVASETLSEQDLKAATDFLQSNTLKTGYDDAAIESYQQFKALREAGIIQRDTKFQVAIPTIANVIGLLIKSPLRGVVESYYEEALVKALQNIQKEIAHEDLAIQLDLGIDMAYWEGRLFQPWFQGRDYVVEYIGRMIRKIDQDVDLGIHFCYGDMNHRHYFEPESLRSVVELGLRIIKMSSHSIKWIHVPVPKSAMGNLQEYFKPLLDLTPELEAQKTEVYLGLVHYGDLQGTIERARAASHFIKEFGVATECGVGRTPIGKIEDILKTMEKMSEPFEDITHYLLIFPS